MTTEELILLLKEEQDVSKAQLEELYSLCQSYPYCSAFHLLLLKGLQQQRDIRYQTELRQRIIYLPEPALLSLSVGGRAATLQRPMPEVAATISVRRKAADALDKIEELLQSTDLAPEPGAEGLVEQPGQMAEQDETAIEHAAREQKPEAEDEGLFSEAMVKLYIKRAKYKQAKELMEDLYLKYPKKNAYFAQQIKYLDKLILNQTGN